MPQINTLCVFCGAYSGADPAYAESARETGRLLAQRGIRLVYGAGRVGLMGLMADAMLEAGGQVTGVIPHFLKEREVWHHGIQELILTDTMHERKALMADRADAFMALPGGIGTLDELAEIMTWAQLGLHKKPIAVVNL